MYEKSKEEFEKLRSDNQELVEKEYIEFVNRLKNEVINAKDQNIILLSKIGIIFNKDKFYMVSLYIAILVFGLLMLFPSNISNIPLYIFGFVFFIGGFQIAIGEDNTGFGIIFLFSHGGAGIGIMIYSLLLERLNLAMLSDINGNLKVYIIITAFIILFSFICTVIYNLSYKYKTNIYNKVILQLFYLVGIVLVGLLPIISF